MKRWFSFLMLVPALLLPCTRAVAACTNQVASETFSPNGLMKAVVFIRDCQARGRNAHVSVLHAFRVLPEGPGNTFVGEAGLGRSEDGDRSGIQVNWLSDGELSVLHGTVRRIRYENRVRGVKVFYGHLIDVPPRQWP